MGDTITRRSGGGNYRRQLRQRLHGDESRAHGQHGTRQAIRHPDGNRGCVLVVIAQPQLATRTHRAPNTQGLAVQRMPEIVNGDVLSVVGGM